jgi:hypothetical protein
MVVQPTANPNAVELLRVAEVGGPHVVGDMLLYTDSEGLARIPKAGGTPEPLFTDPVFPAFRVANDLVYFIRDYALYSVSATAPSTTAATVIASVEYAPTTDQMIDVDATNLYMSVRATNEIRALSLATGAPTALVTGVESQGHRLVNGFIYFVGPYDSIMRVAVTGGAAETLFEGNHIVWSIGVDGADLYYGGSGSLFRTGMPFETELAYWDIDFLTFIQPVGDRILFSGREGGVGWVMKDGSRCQGIAESRFGLSGWDTDGTNVFLVMDEVLYRIPL